MWAIYKSVFLEAFLWGLGTALGELPPYFVALSASLAGSHDEEIADLLQHEAANSGSESDSLLSDNDEGNPQKV
jgi:hypothetical protein